MAASKDIQLKTDGSVRPKRPTSTARQTPRAPRATAELALAPELELAVGFRLRRAVSVADALFTGIFAPLDITTQQYAILMSVRHNPGCQPSALSALLNITPNNLVPHIDALVTRGYMRRTASSTDRRVKHLRLTAAGEEFAQLLGDKHDEVRARIEARMGAENVDLLLELLKLYEG
jgi:DNA-binding MarR family transcriptional regulator